MPVRWLIQTVSSIRPRAGSFRPRVGQSRSRLCSSRAASPREIGWSIPSSPSRRCPKSTFTSSRDRRRGRSARAKPPKVRQPQPSLMRWRTRPDFACATFRSRRTVSRPRSDNRHRRTREELMKTDITITNRRLANAPMGEEERKARIELAACYRLAHREGWDELIYNHISARVPGPDHHFLINPFGLAFEEVTASNLVKIDRDGTIIGDSPYPINAAGFTIHSAVHAGRPEVGCVIHLHTEAGMALSMLADGLEPLSQTAM